ncbi:Rossmann-like domain-containing protein [Aliikangiella maris]|uniref:DUF364 domain-containing protein n=2 Tax=Aliikangiella maris TaxID=3162458 RepID=A0ABV3MQ84_9GAMM
MSQKVNGLAPSDISQLIEHVFAGNYGELPENLTAVGAFWVSQSTQFNKTSQKYKNFYLLLRVENAFGGCCVEESQLNYSIAQEIAGSNLADLIRHDNLAIKIAALDAYLGYVKPHSQAKNVTEFLLPAGTPITRAVARDQQIINLLNIQQGQKVGLIGVVNPLVDAIEEKGAQCLPCDFNIKKTQSGIDVVQDMLPVLQQADYLIATGMTLSNGSFEKIVETAKKRDIPLVFYAQTGANIIPQFLNSGVTAVLSELFPFSQFSAIQSPVYLYRQEGTL